MLLRVGENGMPVLLKEDTTSSIVGNLSARSKNPASKKPSGTTSPKQL